MKNEVMILGGFGFLGSHLTPALLHAGYNVSVFARRPSKLNKWIHELDRVQVYYGDHADVNSVLQAIKGKHTVIHLIHTTFPGSSMHDPVFDVSSNVISTLNWLTKIHELSIKQIIFVSTGGAIYGEPAYLPIDETHPTNPTSSYGISKLAIEKYLAIFAAKNGVALRILRPGNVYGLGQHTRTGQGVVGAMVQQAMDGRALELWGDGSVIRDYLHVNDFVEAIIRLMRYDGTESIFNCGTRTGYSVLDVIEILNRCLQQRLSVIRVAGRPFDISSNILDSSRLAKATGWQAQVILEHGIEDLVAQIRD